MLNRIKRTDNRGFTIIEVMIVLAVAALILLIVLLAVPALQRNSRNTTIKNDVSALSGGINTFESDNNGITPGLICGTGTVTISAGGSCGSATAPTETIHLNGSTATTASVPAGAEVIGSPLTTASDLATSTIAYQPGHSCPDNGQAVSSAATSTRSIALYYVVETSGGNTLECASS